MHIQETGAHYCQFTWESNRGTDGKNHVSVVDTTKEDLDKQIEHCALMLPYNNLSKIFQRQFTLIYSDWDVLRCNSRDQKGIPQLEKRVFTEEYINNISLNI